MQGVPRTRRDQYRVWKRIAAGVTSNHDLAEQLGLSESLVADIKCDACRIIWQEIVKSRHTSLIDELCARE